MTRSRSQKHGNKRHGKIFAAKKQSFLCKLIFGKLSFGVITKVTVRLVAMVVANNCGGGGQVHRVLIMAILLASALVVNAVV